MAGGQEVGIMGYKFKTRPKFILRRMFGDYLPYLQGSKPPFNVIVTAEDEDNTEREIQIFTVFPDGHSVEVRYDIPHLKKGQKVRLQVGGSFQAVTGDTKITVDHELNVSSQGKRPRQYQTLYSFHIIPKTWFSLAIIAGAFAGILNAISQYLIRLVDC